MLRHTIVQMSPEAACVPGTGLVVEVTNWRMEGHPGHPTVSAPPGARMASDPWHSQALGGGPAGRTKTPQATDSTETSVSLRFQNGVVTQCEGKGNPNSRWLLRGSSNTRLFAVFARPVAMVSQQWDAMPIVTKAAVMLILGEIHCSSCLERV